MTRWTHGLSPSHSVDSIEAPGFGFLPLLPHAWAPLPVLGRLLRGLWSRLIPWLVPLALLVLWQISSASGWLSSCSSPLRNSGSALRSRRISGMPMAIRLALYSRTS